MALPSKHNLDLENASVLITGGASGIGAALVKGFAAQGANVAFLDIDVAASQRTIAAVDYETNHRPVFAQCDLRNIDEMRRAVEDVTHRLGGLDILINNAAWDDRHDFSEVTPDYFDNNLSINLRPAYFVTQACTPHLKRSQKASVINFSSIAFMMNLPDMPVYLTAKAGIIGMTKGLAGKLGPDGIRVNALLPGMVMTPRQKELWVSDDAAATHREKQCLKFTLEADDMIGPCLFLASPLSRAITAQSIIVDGGYF